MEHSEQQSPKKLSGMSMYAVACVTMLGSGVLYTHLVILNGGILAGAIGILLCMISAYYIACATHTCIYRRELCDITRNASSNGNSARVHAVQPNTPQIEETACSTVETTCSTVETTCSTTETSCSTVEYASLLPEEDVKVRRALQGIIVFQAALSSILYVVLIKTWASGLIKNIVETFELGGVAEYSIIGCMAIAVVGMCLYLSLRVPGEGSMWITVLSIMSIFTVLLILTVMCFLMENSSIPVKSVSGGHNGIFAYLVGKGGIGYSAVGIAAMLFAVDAQNLIPIYLSKIKDKRRSTFVSVPLISIMAVGSVFLVIGVLSYYVLSNQGVGSALEKDILTDLKNLLENFKSNNLESKFSTVFFIVIILIKIIMLPILFSAFMWQSTVYRDILLSSSKKTRNRYFPSLSPETAFIAIAAFITFSTILIACIDPEMHILVTIVGGIATGFTMLVMPAYLIYRRRTSLSGKVSSLDKVFGVIMIVGFIVLASCVCKEIASYIKEPASIPKIPNNS
ncbi:hypothetical protein NEFER03_0418 [Nematocida sp. LUAm3]|nr:hypothetical protein NEFER03_0418 [Nematocida sp. LUAm3]KAI5175876.1 hypothetical protein NEFER02_1736 [Nematocida sp. LUAm2]KAI5178742.1 hypothetical protein NEFER01_1861 [Nematocida sp. LUAm1]